MIGSVLQITRGLLSRGLAQRGFRSSCHLIGVRSSVVGYSIRNMSKRPEKISQFKLEGLTCAPCTPFKPNGDLNLDIYDQYVQHLLDYGVSNIFAVGTTGECNNMTVEERKLAAEAWIKAGKGKMKKILIHIGAANLRESMALAKHADTIGADAIACVGPTYYKPETIDCYVDYMAEVASAAPNLPFYLYDINFYTGIEYDLDKFFSLAKERIPNLRGVKHTSPIFPSMNTLLVNHPDIQVILGSDEMYLQALSIGMGETIMNSYQGVILAKLKAAFDKGDIIEARRLQTYALKICNIRRKHDLSVPGGTKAVLKAIGLDCGQPRLGLKPFSDQTVSELKKELTEIGFYEWGVPK